jgi:hypothetical protein
MKHLGWKPQPEQTGWKPLPEQTEWNQATQAGPLWDRYCTYVDSMEEIGAPHDKIKTFDQWINA